MTAQAVEAPRFIRKTQLAPGEYRKNFQQIDREVIATVTSSEADQVTPLMSKIYLRMVNAPDGYWEREGVLRFEAEVREGKHVKAWSVLCEVLGVASATASKALKWMHDAGVIGYFAGKNGVGIRIFLNRAASSIGKRAAQGGEKILEFPPASSRKSPASRNEPAFKDNFVVPEVSDTDLNSRAPKNGANQERLDKKVPDPVRPSPCNPPPFAQNAVPIEEIVSRLKSELEPAMREAARQAAACEHERTREWLENRGLPKAARVAQHEAYNVLRKYGVISESGRDPRAHAEVGRGSYVAQGPRPLLPEEVIEMAGVCHAMLETKGQSIEVTLSEMSAEAGGFLLPEDAGRVRERANSLLSAQSGGEGK
jgi:hypothetical protein